MVGCGVELMAWAQPQFLGPGSDWYDAWAEKLCLGVLSGATTFVERRTGGSGEWRRRVACRASTCLAIPTCSSRSQVLLSPPTPLRLSVPIPLVGARSRLAVVLMAVLMSGVGSFPAAGLSFEPLQNAAHPALFSTRSSFIRTDASPRSQLHKLTLANTSGPRSGSARMQGALLFPSFSIVPTLRLPRHLADCAKDS